MPDKYDVVVIGAGPVGLMLSACLTRLGPYKIKHIDKAVEPTRAGRASGIQPRTLDVLSTMGLKRPIWAYNPGLIQEVAFWATTTDGKGIQRTGTSKSYPEHVDTRYPFTTILHQGRVERIFLDDVRSRGVQVQRSRVIRSVRYLGPDVEYPVEAELANVDGSATETVRTKYLFGADGARSAVRAMLGIPMVYKDPTVHVWGVIDGVVKTDFPDMQIKCTVRTPRGACMVIPHGNNRVRVYVQMSREGGEVLPASGSQETIQRTANNILSPYKVEWECVDWHSVYPIGQGIAQQYSMHNRIFIGGDACHTHSPKAGQGMNYGILDTHNLAWKLHLVECGLMRPDLLETYEEERRAVASRLIEFDATYAGLFSSHNPSQETNDEFVRIYKQNTQLTSGYGVEYPANKLTQIGDGDDIFISSLAKLQPGRSFPPVNVTRVIDARNVSLEREVPFNGSFNIVVFAGEQGPEQRTLVDLASQLGRRGSVFSRVQKNAAAVDLPYERRHNPHSPLYTFSIVFNQVRASVAISALPHFFLPYRYHIYSDDARAGKTHETGQGVAHKKMGFDPREGGVVIVRPDGYVGCVVRLVEGRATADALDQYFSAVVPGDQPSDMVPSML